MAQVINGSQVKLQDGKTIQAQQGGWYDGQQFWGGTLSAPGVINSLSNQEGAGQAVSKEVVQQTNPNNWDYIQKQQQSYQPSATSQPMPSSAPSSSGAGMSGAGIGFQAPQDTFDPTKFYETAYGNSGIRDIEAQFSAKTNAYNEQIAKIKDNPYLSEATMTGRISKLDQKFAADSAAMKNDIATKKADVETQLNLQLKKLDINSAATKQAMDQFNTLLSSGALSGANGEDIANITRATGISSSMIQSAIAASNKKNNPVNVSTFTGENGEVFAVALDSNGNMVNKQSLGVIGNVQGKSGGSSGTSTAQVKSQFVSDANSAVGSADIFPTLVQQYAPYLSLQDIYKMYLTTDPGKYYGKPKEDATQIQAWYTQNRGK